MFSHSAALYDALYHWKDYRGEAAHVASLIRDAQPQAHTVLDVACGTGEHARWLASHGFEVDGLDLDRSLLAIAQQKHPHGRFHTGDMSAFAMGRRYDAVTCPFGSIAYLVTLERVARALQCFRAHLARGGVLIVEPWFGPGVIDPTRVTRQKGHTVDSTVERTSQIDVEGRVSRLRFDYTIEEPSGVRHAQEVHELGLFTNDEMRETFERAGFAMTFDAEGLMGRGLWYGRTAI